MNDKHISIDNLELAIEGLKIGMTNDWNQNDPSALGYIKNRTHYEEVAWDVIFEEQTMSFNDDGTVIRALCPLNPDKIDNLANGIMDGGITSLRVIFDGVTYDIKNDQTAPIPFIFGNLSLFPDPNFADKDTGEPFCVVIDYEALIIIKTEGEHTVSISYQNGTVVHQLDEKYIPDTVARVEDIDNNINEIVDNVDNINKTLEQKISYNTNRINTNTTQINKNIVAIEEKLSYGYEGLTYAPYDDKHYANNLMYGNGKFICVSTSKGGSISEVANNLQIYYSTDCINWTQSFVIDSCMSCQCVYGNGLFVIVPFGSITSDYNKSVYYSSDGINWNYTTISPPNKYAELFYGGGKFLLLYSSSSIGFYSLNGIDWVQINTSILNSSNIARYGTYANDNFFIAKYNSDSKNRELYQSDDFTNWTLLSTWTSDHFYIKYINDKFILYGNNINTRGYLYSEDAINWTYVDSYSPGLMACSDNVIVAKSNTDSTTCLSSRDGIHWTTSQFPIDKCNHLFYLNGKFVALDSLTEPYKIYYSNDAGITWTQEINSKIVQNGEDVTAKVKNVILHEAPYIPTPYNATTGQTIAVKAVDERGKPTEWEAVNTRSDWNQNDPSAPDYIKNKPVVFVGGDTLTWDGNTEGLVPVLDMYYKVSDVVITAEDIDSGNNLDDTKVKLSTGDFMNGGFLFAPGFIAIGEVCFIISEEAVGIDFDGLYFQEAGIYFAYLAEEGAEPVFASALTIPGYTGFDSEKIAPSYLYQSDWNQNDENEPDYIKNRTHWAEPEYEVYVSETSETDFIKTDNDSLFAIGEKYTVIYDGVSYECIGYMNFNGELCIGDSRLFEDNESNPIDIPFAAISYMDAPLDSLGGSIFAYVDIFYVDDNPHTIEVKKATGNTSYHKLDKNYLPMDDIFNEIMSRIPRAEEASF